MTDKTKAKALAALDGMREIVRREMVEPGNYIDEEISEPRYVGALCGGRKHCALGSLWVGAGVKLVWDEWGSPFIPGIGEYERSEYLRHRPGLRAAYDALNAAATDYAAKNDFNLGATAWVAPIESLFEGYFPYSDGVAPNDEGRTLTKRDLLSMIAAAKRRIKAA